MLTPSQQKYLSTITKDKVAHIQPFNIEVRNTAEEIISEINKILPELEVRFIGSAALGISGQNDVDLHILSKPEDYKNYISKLVDIFGQPSQQNPQLIKWSFVKNSFDVELYLTNMNSPALKEQIKTFELLKNNPNLRTEYENLKKESDGIPFVEYMQKKYEFFNKILGL